MIQNDDEFRQLWELTEIAMAHYEALESPPESLREEILEAVAQLWHYMAKNK